MDVLLISGAPPYPLNDPARTLVHYLARDLGQYHYVIDLVTFFSEPEDFAEIPRYERYFRQVEFIPRPELTPSMLQERVENPDIRFPVFDGAAWSRQMWSTISDLITNRHYDVVQVVGGLEVYEYFHLIRSLPNVFISALSSLRLRHELDMAASNRRKHRQLQEEYDVIREYETWMYTPYQHVVVSTPEELHLMQKLTQAQVSVMPPGIDMDYFVPTGHEPSVPGLMFIGDFADPTVQAAARRLCEVILPVVQRSIPGATLFLVGGNVPDDLREFESNTVVFTGDVPDLRPLFELATVYVNPLARVMQFQLDILQALAMMTPVVATPEVHEGLDLRPGHDILLGSSSGELADSVLRLLQDDKARLQIQINGREQIHRSYAWDRVARRYEALHRQLIDAR